MARKEPVDFDTNHPIHDSIFGDDRYGLAPDVTIAPTRRATAANTMPATSAQPEGFQPMRDVGDTDQVDRQPDGSLRR